jgi:hypothetical protein
MELHGTNPPKHAEPPRDARNLDASNHWHFEVGHNFNQLGAPVVIAAMRIEVERRRFWGEALKMVISGEDEWECLCAKQHTDGTDTAVGFRHSLRSSHQLFATTFDVLKAQNNALVRRSQISPHDLQQKYAVM